MDSLGRAALRIETLSTRIWTQAHPAMQQRYGLHLAFRAGVACFTAERGLFGDALTYGHKAIGFGTTVPATQAVLDAVRAVYDARGGPCRIQVVEGLTSPEAIRLLLRNGYRREEFAFDWHVRVSTRVPRPPDIEGVHVHRVARDEVTIFSTTARDAFGDTGRVREYFHATLVALLRDHPRWVSGFLARRGGAPAGTGGVLISAGAAGLFSGAVLSRHRGHGLQKALIVARIRYGMGRGVRVFFSQTHENPVSAANLAELGFRRRWRIVHWSAE